MRKTVFAAAFAALALVGCAKEVERLGAAANVVGAIATTEVKNPITEQNVYELRAAHIAAQRLVIAYRRIGVCAEGAIPTISKPCASRSVLRVLADMDKKARQRIDQLAVFIRDNPRLDATSLYNAAKDLISTFRANAEAVAKA